MPWVDSKDIHYEGDIIGAAIALPVLAVAGIGIGIVSAIRKSNERKRKEEEQRIKRERFSDKIHALIAESDNVLDIQRQSNFVQIIRLKENEATIGTTYATLSFVVPKHVKKISNLVFSNLDNYITIKFNKNGSPGPFWDLTNESHYLDMFRMKMFSVKPGDVITVECETRNKHDEIKDLCFYTMTPSGELFYSTEKHYYNSASNTSQDFLMAYRSEDGYGIIQSSITFHCSQDIIRVKFLVRLINAGNAEDYIIDHLGTIVRNEPFILCHMIDKQIVGNTVELYVVEYETADGKVFTFSPDEKNRTVLDNDPESIQLEEGFINSLPKHENLVPRFYYYKGKNYYYCPYCGSPNTLTNKACTSCNSDTSKSSEFTEENIKKKHEEWVKVKEHEALIERERIDRENKIKAEKRKKTLKICAIAFLAVAVVAAAVFLFVIKPANERKAAQAAYEAKKAAAISAYESLKTEEERIKAYETVLEWYGLPVITLKDGDKVVSTEELMPGSVIAKTLPDKDGKHFLGWAEDGSDEVLSPLVSPTVSSTLHAVYGFKAIFVGYDGQVLEEKMVKEGNQYTVDNIPDQRIGASVNKWKNTTTGETVYASTTKLNITQDVVYKAGYSLSTAFYRQDGSLYKRTTSDYGETVEFTDLASDPAFLGWSTSPDKNAPVDYASSSFKVTENNISLYLRTSNSVTYKPEGRYGENLPSSFEAETGYKLVLPGSPIQNDSVGFVGWLIDNKVYSQSESVTVNGNIEIQAVYTNLKWQGSARGSYISAFVDKQGKIVSKPETVEEMKTITEYRVSQSYFTVSNSGALSLSAEGKKAVKNFEYIDIPEKLSGVNITEIGASAFANSTSLKSIKLPKSITKIGNQAFQWSALELDELDLTGVTSIGTSAFSGCTIRKLILNDNVKNYSAVNGIFWYSGMKGLETIEYAKGTKVIYGKVMNDDTRKTLTTVIIPEGVTEIEASAFANCKALKSIKLPKSLTKIGNSAFQWSALELDELDLTGVSSIGTSAFSGCTIRKLILNDNVKNYSAVNGIFWYTGMKVESVFVPRWSSVDYTKYFEKRIIEKY